MRKEKGKNHTEQSSNGIFEYSLKTSQEIISELDSNFDKGLSNETVSKKRNTFGLNTLTLHEVKAWNIFFRQFKSAFIYLLFGAMAITVFLGEYVDALMILAFLAVNTTLGFIQEYRSEKTIKLLNKYALPRCRVLRDGKIEQITSDKLVPGDIVVLETGDKVPADVRVIEENNLIVDEAILTGESISVFKKSEALKIAPQAYHEASNLGFSGTDVVKGKAKAVVIATGKNTAFGQIAKLTVESRKISDFEKGIAHFSNFIFKLVGVTLVIVFAANIAIKGDRVNILELIIFSVALTISVVPEALPLVMTFSLARGARRLAKNKVIVKRLSAIEDLGAIEVLCSDKTGTLTKNELKIAGIFSKDKDKALLYANMAASLGLEEKTEPFDIALEKKLSKEQKRSLKKVAVIAEEPFDPKIKRNVSLVEYDNKKILITRGAPEEVIKCCSRITKADKDKMHEWIRSEGVQGHRVLAVAYKEIAKTAKKSDNIISDAKAFNFSGVISFVDPIKGSSYTTVQKAKVLGVRVVVITGDSLEVAGAVGHEIGLISSPEKVMSGEEWENMERESRLACLEEYSVFARVSPEQKFKIIKSLQEKHVVGFLGEGINDAPALKISSVSLVVDSASDIAREAADIVLLKKNLGVILDGISEGRQVFANSTKYIKSTLASNFGNFFAVAISSLFIDFLPMLPIQILLLNLLSDTPMISISTDRVDQEELVSPRKYEVKDIIILAIILGIVSTVFDFIFFALYFNDKPTVLQTNWFIGSTLTELALIFSIRTRFFFLRGTRPSYSISVLSMVIIFLTIIIPFTKFGSDIFKFSAPSLQHLLTILTLVVVYLCCTEIVKLFYYHNGKKNHKQNH